VLPDLAAISEADQAASVPGLQVGRATVGAAVRREVLGSDTRRRYDAEHMFVLGIDPGLTRTGYGIIEATGSGERAVAAGAIRTDPSQPLGERFVELARDLRAIVADYEPQAAAIEQVFVNKNRQTAMSVARASGIALLVISEAGLETAEYTPSAVKLALTGSGVADKQQMQRVVAMRLGLTSAPRPADAADALAVALCHVQHRTLTARIS
jgi:crossover junction endodeoxyribonuclease RuvC